MSPLRPARVLGATLLLFGSACGADEALAPPDAAAPDAADAPMLDAGVCVTSFPACRPAPLPDPSCCAAAVSLGPRAPLTAQDTATGGYGDCAMSGSGLGGPGLYYRVSVPPGRLARVSAVPDSPGEDALVRAFTSCGDLASAHSSRGGALTQGQAAVCLANPDSTARDYLIAVSRYSGEAACLPITFDLSLDVRLPDEGCQEIE